MQLRSAISLFLYLLFAFSGASFSGENASKQEEILLFIGNPGAGKSTLINSILSRHAAESGLNPGEGLTKQFQAFKHNGKLYIDTPGLCDVKIRSQASNEITQALSLNNYYRIFFVLTLNAGRLKPEDIRTITSVMDAIGSGNKSFNIIINQLSRKERVEIIDNEVKLAELHKQLNVGFYKAAGIYYIDKSRTMEDNEAEFITIDANLDNFLHHTSSHFYLAAKEVRDINGEDMEALKQRFAKEEAEVRRGLEERRRLQAEMAAKIQITLEKMARTEEEARQYQLALQCL